jgi:nucleoside-diphosphate-sugar epimerase
MRMLEAPRVLVTGAGGFIGSRIVEMMHEMGFATVRAGVRRWAAAARIGRFPVEIVQCDVTDAAQVRSVIQGMDWVVHCAVGPREVTVQGTENVLRAAHEAGVKRVVHLSTIDVYGEVSGETAEEAALTPTGKAYGDSKIEAEQICRRFQAEGLPVVILRPTIVYGPYSAAWTIEFAERLQVRPWPFAKDFCQGICNLVYIDDLVHAVILALTGPEAVGQAFNVNGPDRPTWHEYFEALNDAMGLPPLVLQARTASTLSAWTMQPVRSAAKFGLRHFQVPIMAMYQRYDLAKKVMKLAERMIKKAPTTNEFRLFSKVGRFSTAKAERLIGYRPRFDMADGISMSVQWLRHHGFIKAPIQGPKRDQHAALIQPRRRLS